MISEELRRTILKLGAPPAPPTEAPPNPPLPLQLLETADGKEREGEHIHLERVAYKESTRGRHGKNPAR
jgi:hypothetical protein